MGITGIDGGCPGAAVHIDDTARLLWLAYWDADSEGRATVRIVRRLPAEQGVTRFDVLVKQGAYIPARIGNTLAWAAEHFSGPHWKAGRVVVEDTFVGKDPAVALSLTWESGAQAGPLESAMCCRAHRYLATIWREEVLKLPGNTHASTAKKRSMDEVPVMIEGLSKALGVLNLDRKHAHHVTDAGGVALCLYSRLIGDLRRAG